jgi:hypothetical protein
MVPIRPIRSRLPSSTTTVKAQDVCRGQKSARPRQPLGERAFFGPDEPRGRPTLRARLVVQHSCCSRDADKAELDRERGCELLDD